MKPSNARPVGARHPQHQRWIKCQKIADCGGSAAARFNMSSNESSLYHVNVMRFAKRLVSLRISSDQNFSLENCRPPLPRSWCRATPADILKTLGEAVSDCDNGVIFGKSGIPNAALFNCCEYHRGGGKGLSGSAGQRRLRERPSSQSGRVGRLVRRHADIFDERSFRVSEPPVINEWSLISSGHRDCRSSSERMFLAYSLQGPNLDQKSEASTPVWSRLRPRRASPTGRWQRPCTQDATRRSRRGEASDRRHGIEQRQFEQHPNSPNLWVQKKYVRRQTSRTKIERFALPRIALLDPLHVRAPSMMAHHLIEACLLLIQVNKLDRS